MKVPKHRYTAVHTAEGGRRPLPFVLTSHPLLPTVVFVETIKEDEDRERLGGLGLDK